MANRDPLAGVSKVTLRPATESQLRSLNPWWDEQPQRVLPASRRWPYEVLRRQLLQPVAPVIAVKGPRQVGKSVLQEQLIADLLGPGGVDPRYVFRVQFDGVSEFLRSDSGLGRAFAWYQRNILGVTANAAARVAPVYLFLHELQNLPKWSDQLKFLVDTNTVRVLLTGSSALRIERGRDSLAGRIYDIQLGPLLVREVAQFQGQSAPDPYLPFNGSSPLKEAGFWQGIEQWAASHAAARDHAFAQWARLGGFPFAHTTPPQPWAIVADHLVQTVVMRAIQHDLRIGKRGARRSADLLAAVLRLACRYVGQTPTIASMSKEIDSGLGGGINHVTISNYLKFLEATLLVRRLPPLEIRASRAGAGLKFVLCDHAIRAAFLQEVIPLDPDELDVATDPIRSLAGRIAESAVGQFFAETPGVQLSHLSAKKDRAEIDYVLTVGDQRIPVEVKYQAGANTARDGAAIRKFVQNSANRASFGVLVTRNPAPRVASDGVIPVSLRSLLFIR